MKKVAAKINAAVDPELEHARALQERKEAELMRYFEQNPQAPQEIGALARRTIATRNTPEHARALEAYNAHPAKRMEAEILKVKVEVDRAEAASQAHRR